MFPQTANPGLISEAVGKLTVLTDQGKALRLRRINRIRTIRGSLAIEGITLSEAQITAILDGKRVIAPPREVQEVHNALAAYDRFGVWRPEVEKDLLEAHRILMSGLIDEAGLFRQGGVGVMAGSQVIQVAPPTDHVPTRMSDLFRRLAAAECFITSDSSRPGFPAGLSRRQRLLRAGIAGSISH